MKYLQERTRLVEETGVDSERPANGGYPVLPVLCSELAWSKPFDLTQLPEHKKRHLPKASWHRISDAAIGWLPEYTFPGGVRWAAAGFMDTLLRWKMKPEVVYGNEKAIQPGVQA